MAEILGGKEGNFLWLMDKVERMGKRRWLVDSIGVLNFVEARDGWPWFGQQIRVGS